MSERTITVKPGDRITIVCEGEGSNTNVANNDEAFNFNASTASAPRNTGSPNSMLGGKKSKKNRTRKNQAGGKKGANPYMKFAAEVRPQIMKENPELKGDVTKVARKIGEKWRALSDAEKAKY